VVKNGLKLDYEQARTHKVTVEAKDDEGLVTLKTFTINLANVDPEVVNGTAASETFFGGAGRDVLNGGAGNDTLGGGLGNDVLTGGTGSDSFVFNTTLSGTKNVDTIKSFSVKDDTIRLENAIFKKLTKTGTLSKDSFVVGDKAKDSKDYVVYNDKTGAPSYDADGSGKGGAIKIAQLDKKKNVTTITDFNVKDDTIRLENAIFKKLGKAGMLNKSFFVVGSKAYDKNDYVIYNKKTGYLYYDPDGSGHSGAVLFAKLKPGLELTHNDFIVI